MANGATFIRGVKQLVVQQQQQQQHQQQQHHSSSNLIPVSGLVWFITGAGARHYACVVGAAPLQRHPTVLNSQPGRALNAEVTAQRTWAFCHTPL
jgi:hypothetical protein